MNDYQNLNKAGGCKKKTRKAKNQEWHLLSLVETRPQKKQKYNKNGESHFFHCGGEDHWANNCPELNKEHQGKLHDQFKNE